MHPSKDRAFFIIFTVFITLDSAYFHDTEPNVNVERCVSEIAKSFQIEDNIVTKQFCVKNAILYLTDTNSQLIGPGFRYYMELIQELDSQKISSPYVFCNEYFTNDTFKRLVRPSPVPEEGRCLDQLRIFPNNSEDAFNYAISSINIRLFDETNDFVTAYLLHMWSRIGYTNYSILPEPRKYCRNLVELGVTGTSQ